MADLGTVASSLMGASRLALRRAPTAEVGGREMEPSGRLMETASEALAGASRACSAILEGDDAEGTALMSVALSGAKWALTDMLGYGSDFAAAYGPIAAACGCRGPRGGAKVSLAGLSCRRLDPALLAGADLLDAVAEELAEADGVDWSLPDGLGGSVSGSTRRVALACHSAALSCASKVVRGLSGPNPAAVGDAFWALLFGRFQKDVAGLCRDVGPAMEGKWEGPEGKGRETGVGAMVAACMSGVAVRDVIGPIE